MSSYNTVDLEASEAQPLVAAPRKLGKTLVVVALFGFAAGAATVTAAPHVAAKMNLAGGESTEVVATEGGLSKDNKYADIIAVDGTPAADATTMTTPAQEPAQDAAIVNYFKDTAAEPQSNKPCNKQTGGESLVSANCQTATVQGNANGNGKAPHITGRK